MSSLPPFPAAEADQCVKCGLCLPHCPSYTATGHEGDSPRGRITLMQGFASGTLAPTDRLQDHLDGCLGCRACEPVCPARVPYGHILDAGRARLAQARPAPGLQRRLRWMTSPAGGAALRLAHRLWHALRLSPLAQGLGLFRVGRLGRLLSLLPSPALRWRPLPTAGADRGEVLLFTGCTGRSLDAEALAASETVLRGLGFRPRQVHGCCGALLTHAGDAAGGAAQAARAAAQLAGDAPIISIATGCGAQLAEHPDATVRRRVVDALQFVRQHWPDDLQLQPLPDRVSLHLACSQRNVLKREEDLRWLAAQLPTAAVQDLDPTQRCCGAAGHHLLAHPAIADGHLAPKVDALRSQAPQWVVSSNVGCSLHLAGGLRRAGLNTPRVVHPLVLLARQWPR